MQITCENCGHLQNINPAALMGKLTSDKKKTSAQINGAKGGRPKKPKVSIVKEPAP